MSIQVINQSWAPKCMRQIAFAAAMILAGSPAAFAKKVTHTFGQFSKSDPAWTRYFSPNQNYFQFARGGWVIDYQGGPKSEPMRPGGFSSNFKLEGDFTVRLNYSLSQASASSSRPGITLQVYHPGSRQYSSLSHLVDASGEPVFVASVYGGRAESFPKQQEFPARWGRSIMRIRHAGKGDYVFSAGSGGAAAVELAKLAGPAGEPGQVQIRVSNSREPTPFRAKISRIVVESDRLLIGTAPATTNRVPWFWIGIVAAAIGGFAAIYRIILAGKTN